MDPLSITTAVITFVTLGNSILDAARRVHKNSKRINELAEDVVADLNLLQDFCVTHQQALRRSSELRTSLAHLERELAGSLAICKHLHRRGSAVARFGINSWFRADKVEATVSRLRDQIRTTLSRCHFYIAARSEVTVSRVEHQVLSLQATVNTQLRQFDLLFLEAVSREEFSLNHRDLDVLDPWDRHYFEYQMSQVSTSICTLRDADIVVNGCIPPQFHSYWSTNPYTRTKTQILRSFSHLLKIANELIKLGHVTSQLLGEFIDYLLGLYDFLKSHASLLDFLRTMTTRMTSISDDDNVWVALTAFLYFTQPDTASRISRLEDFITVHRKLLSMGRRRQGKWPMSFHYKRLVVHLSARAFQLRIQEREDDAVITLHEVIQLIYSSEAPCTYEHFAPLQLERDPVVEHTIRSVTRGVPSLEFCVDARVAQFYAAVLSRAYCILSSFCRYDDARMVALMARQLINGFQSASSHLPSDFDTLRDRLEWMEEALPASFNIERNVCSAFVEEEVDTAEDVGGSHDNVVTFATGQEVVEWGIAI
ncbi:hypothetical protein ONZ45_g3365 [Pleurotus djamor]|nr:hypothetical protein ONZ45_g3365 [Pleurotus djamor]